ncbi:CapA family protein [Brevibacterium album]|uniref:CapA family protein n=1 Tax=Brevibacterium album TaxID=417948 RepID=UPI00146F9E5B|nr:CapA family protein [Brevibacterium album]
MSRSRPVHLLTAQPPSPDRAAAPGAAALTEAPAPTGASPRGGAQRVMGAIAAVLAVSGAALGIGTAVLDGSAHEAGAGTAASGGARDGAGQGEGEAASASLRLAFAGDVHFERQLRPVGEDPEGLSELLPHFAGADLAMVNLETAITSAGERIPGKDFAFRAPESSLTTLANAGIDAVSMANNHAADYGAAGLEDTLAAAGRSPVEIIGVGEDADAAFAPLSREVNGARVAVLAASALWEDTYTHHEATETSPGIAAFVEPERMLAEVEAAAEGHDVVIAYMHMGEEGSTCVREVDAQRARSLTEAGADIVIAAHAHRLAGMGHQDGAFIAYGLGNFVWYTGGSGPSSHTGVLTLDVEVPAPGTAAPGTRVTDFDLQPMLIGADGIPRVPDVETAQQIESEVEAANRCSPIGA